MFDLLMIAHAAETSLRAESTDTSISFSLVALPQPISVIDADFEIHT